MAYDRPPTRRPRDPLADDIVDAIEERLRKERREIGIIVVPAVLLGWFVLLFFPPS